MKLPKLVGIAATASLLAACGGGGGGGLNAGSVPITSVNPVANAKLQMAVGYATIAGATGLNVVSTLRKSDGTSAVLVSTPTLTGPFTLPAAVTATSASYSTVTKGPSTMEVAAGGTIEGTSQAIHTGTPACNGPSSCSGVAPNVTSFGTTGGVFGLGFAPFNYTANGVASSYVPYQVPLYGSKLFLPWGGPPAFDPDKDNMGVRDGIYGGPASGVDGIAEGITAFQGVTPSTGTYNLSVQIPTGFDSSNNPTFGTVSTSASLSTAANPIAAAVAPTVTPDGAGGATFTVTLPAGAAEGYVEIVDNGGGASSCQGPLGTSAAPVYYTIHVTSSGSVALPDKDGPNTNTSGGTANLSPSPSLCAGDSYTVYLIAFDYPLFSASYPNSSGNAAPQIAGANGQADISISAGVTNTY